MREIHTEKNKFYSQNNFKENVIQCDTVCQVHSHFQKLKTKFRTKVLSQFEVNEFKGENQFDANEFQYENHFEAKKFQSENRLKANKFNSIRSK